MPMLCHRCHDLLLVCRCFVIASFSHSYIHQLFAGYFSMIFEETLFQVWAEPGPFARQTLQFAGNWDCMKYIITVFPYLFGLDDDICRGMQHISAEPGRLQRQTLLLALRCFLLCWVQCRSTLTPL